MLQIGKWNELEVVKEVDFGLYLDGGDGQEVLLPKRYVKRGSKPGDVLRVFVYHDNEGRPIATTDKPFGTVGEIVGLEVGDTTQYGAFLKWGIMKDLFVPVSQQLTRMYQGEKRIVYLYIDEKSGRVTGTEKFGHLLDKEEMDIPLLKEVDVLIWRETEIGFAVIINSKFTGVLHYSDIFREIGIGDTVNGFIKTIRPEGKLDIALGEAGYSRVETEGERILRMLDNNDGYLPFHDKSTPEEIYENFGISKKTFKMTIGSLYKAGEIELTKTGIKRVQK